MALTWELSAGLISLIKNLRNKAISFRTMNKNKRHQSNIREQEKNKRGAKRKIETRGKIKQKCKNRKQTDSGT